MVKKFLLLLVLVALIGAPAFAAPPESWVNNSLSYDWALNSELPLPSGSAETLGYDSPGLDSQEARVLVCLQGWA